MFANSIEWFHVPQQLQTQEHNGKCTTEMCKKSCFISWLKSSLDSLFPSPLVPL